MTKVNSVKSSLVRGAVLAGVASMMAACGGGGGGGGGSGGLPGGPAPADEYVISLSAAKMALPLNIENAGPGIGIDAPYTTTLYVSARRKNTGDVIPGGEDVFGCNVLPSGLEYGALYYLDGDPDHETEVDLPGGGTITVPSAYRAVTLDANAGGASFHFHAGDMAGTAEITCSVSDPQSGKQVSDTIRLTVGQATGRASQVRVNAAAPEYLFAQNTNGPTQLLMQAQVLDDAGQRVPNPTGNNLFAEIVPGSTPGALLRGTGGDGTAVRVRSVNGQAQFSVISGAQTGTVLVRVTADRADNNVDNGIASPVTNLISVPVVAAVGQAPLVIVTATDLPEAYQGLSYATVLVAQGGLPPYTWSRVPDSALPPGLSLSADGVITGAPSQGGVFRFALRTTDSGTIPQTLTREFSIAIGAAPVGEPPAPLIATSALPEGSINTPYLAVVTATEGDGNYAWTAQGLPAGLSITPTGIISGTPTAGGELDVALQVTSAGRTTIRVVRLSIADPSAGDAPKVAFTIPSDFAVDVSPTAELTVVFNEAMDQDSVTPAAFAVYRLTGGQGSPIAATLLTSVEVTQDSDRRFTFRADDHGGFDGNGIIVDPTGAEIAPPYFRPGSSYRVVMSTSPRDLDGNQIEALPSSSQPPEQPSDAPAALWFEFTVRNN